MYVVNKNIIGGNNDVQGASHLDDENEIIII